MQATDLHLGDQFTISLLLDVSADANGVTRIVEAKKLLLACLGMSFPPNEWEVVPTSVDGCGKQPSTNSSVLVLGI